MPFEALGLSAKVVAAVKDAGYNEPTPIQAQAIPHVLARRDVLGIAQTGTGKTAAFTLPMIHMLEQGRARARMPRTLVLEPTRELAAQVEESFVKYGKNQKLNVALLIGGVSFDDQDMKITRGVDVLIATPGRLLDHFERGRLLLTGVELLVIDEADRMLDMGFIPDIERICKLVPFTRQTLFFTATMPPEIKRVTEQFLHNPETIQVARASSTALTIRQGLVKSGRKDFEKRETLRNLINNDENLKNAIIFCNRKLEVANLHKSLLRHNYSAVALHGDLDQSARMKALAAFRDGTAKLLVASDVAARGLDIPDVSHVFNYDMPHHPEDYVHRIGRTGRAGKSGTALTIMTADDQKSLDAIQKLIGAEIPWESEAFTADDLSSAREGRGRRGNDRKSGGAPSRERGSDTHPARDAETREGSSRRSVRPARIERPVVADSELVDDRTAKTTHHDTSRRGHQNTPRMEETVSEDAGHLPNFLLRPVKRARAS